MIFRQFFESVSCTYTYLLASRRGGEALIIDPVLEKVDRYIKLAQAMAGLGSETVRGPRMTLEGEERRRVADVVQRALDSRPKLAAE